MIFLFRIYLLFVECYLSYNNIHIQIILSGGSAEIRSKLFVQVFIRLSSPAMEAEF